MISNFNVVMMYLIGALEILLPLTVLILIYRYKTFAIPAVIAGFACYFLLSSTLVNGIISLILVRLDDPFFFSDHKVLGVLIESGMIALVLTPVFYLFLTKTRKGKWSLYDAMALSISYCIIPMFSNAAIMISQGSIGRLANKGRLAELVDETYTMDSLESLVNTLASITPGELFGQLFGILLSKAVVIAVAVSLGCIVYYAAKRKKIGILILSIVINFIYMVLMYGSESLIGHLGSLAVTVLLGVISVVFIIKFLNYYRNLQLELLRKKQEYKQELKAKAAAERLEKENQKK